MGVLSLAFPQRRGVDVARVALGDVRGPLRKGAVVLVAVGAHEADRLAGEGQRQLGNLRGELHADC